MARRKPKPKSASDAPEALSARQREHRLRVRVEPRERPPSNADPWLLAEEALDLLDGLRRELSPVGRAVRDLEQAQELLKQLAVGPDSNPAAPSFDVTTRSGRMRKSMHKRWHVQGGKPCACAPSVLAEELRSRPQA